MIFHLFDEVFDIRDHDFLKIPQRVEMMSIFDISGQCRVEGFRGQVCFPRKGPLEVFRPGELRHIVVA